jgi:hypothetical protein
VSYWNITRVTDDGEKVEGIEADVLEIVPGSYVFIRFNDGPEARGRVVAAYPMDSVWSIREDAATNPKAYAAALDKAAHAIGGLSVERELSEREVEGNARRAALESDLPSEQP